MSSISQLATRNSQLLAWHGWNLAVPDTWNPVKVDGTWDQGLMLLADMHQAKLGLRWRRAKRGDPEKWADRALKDEVGNLAAKQAAGFAMPESTDWKVSKLYADTDPPGRDVWVGWSNQSSRVLEIVHHVKTRDTFFEQQVLPTVSDTPESGEQAWSIFDLSCKTPSGWKMQWFRLNAGDLTLSFKSKKKSANVRQIGPATLALTRLKLDDWIGQIDKSLRKIYREIDDLSDTTLDLPNRTLTGRRGVLYRKRRLFWAVMFTKKLDVIGVHDEVRNRLFIAQGDDEPAMREMLKSMGWAKKA